MRQPGARDRPPPRPDPPLLRLRHARARAAQRAPGGGLVDPGAAAHARAADGRDRALHRGVLPARAAAPAAARRAAQRGSRRAAARDRSASSLLFRVVSHRKEQKEALRKEREERERKATRGQAAQAHGRLRRGRACWCRGGRGRAWWSLAGGERAAGTTTPPRRCSPTAAACPSSASSTSTAAARPPAASSRARRAAAWRPHHDPRRAGEVQHQPAHHRAGTTRSPADDGAYGEAPPDEELVHNLEHGRVIIWFKPSLPKDERADLKALFDEDTYQMVSCPAATCPTRWRRAPGTREPAPGGTGRLLRLRARSTPRILDALRAFRDEHRSNGPEPVP